MVKKSVAAAPKATGVKKNAVKSTIAKVKPDAGKKSKKDKSSSHPNLLCRMSTCKTCGQNTHAFDQDVLEATEREEYLYWNKREVCKSTGVLTTMGNECGHCLYERINYEETKISQSGLIEKCMADEDHDARRKRLRKDRASGNNEFAGERTQVKNKTGTVNAAFDDAFEEGEFFELYSFARSKQLPIMPVQADQVRVIHENFPSIRFGLGKTGEYGCFVAALTDGASYKYKIGVSNKTVQKQSLGHDSAEAAAEEFEDTSVPVHFRLGGDQPPAASERLPASSSRQAPWSLQQHGKAAPAEAPSTAAPALTEHVVEQLDDDEEDDGNDIGPDDSVSQAGGHSSTSGHTPAPAAKDGTLVSPSKVGKGKRGEAGGKKTTTAEEDLMAAGEKLLVEVDKHYDIDALWNHRYRAREYETLLIRLSTKGSKISSLVKVPGSGILSDQLFRCSVALEARKVFWDNMRSKAIEYCEHPADVNSVGLTPGDKEQLCLAPQCVISNVFCTVHTQLLGRRSNGDLACALNMTCAKLDGNYLCVGLLRCAKRDISFAIQIQTNLLFRSLTRC